MQKLLLLVFLYTGFMEAAISRHNNSNSLGFIQYQDNPYTYKAGAIMEAYVIHDGQALNVRINPSGTYALFYEYILLCGTPTDKFIGKNNPMVLTYETQAHRTVDGIGCHLLIDVSEVKTKELIK
jgi:hypothetical protein